MRAFGSCCTALLALTFFGIASVFGQQAARTFSKVPLGQLQSDNIRAALEEFVRADPRLRELQESVDFRAFAGLQYTPTNGTVPGRLVLDVIATEDIDDTRKKAVARQLQIWLENAVGQNLLNQDDFIAFKPVIDGLIVNFSQPPETLPPATPPSGPVTDIVPPVAGGSSSRFTPFSPSDGTANASGYVAGARWAGANPVHYYPFGWGSCTSAQYICGPSYVVPSPVVMASLPPVVHASTRDASHTRPQQVPGERLSERIVAAAACEDSGSGNASSYVAFNRNGMSRRFANYSSHTVSPYYAEAYQLYWKQDYQDALELLDLALEMEPLDVRCWYYKGFSELSLGQNQAGVSSLARATQLHLAFGQHDPRLDKILERIQGRLRIELEVARTKIASTLSSGSSGRSNVASR